MKNSTVPVKSVVRIAVDEQLGNALDLLKRIKYPFLKDDAIFKLAISQLYSGEHIVSNKDTTVINLLLKMRTKDPKFGVEWLAKNNLREEDIGVEEFSRMILDLTNSGT